MTVLETRGLTKRYGATLALDHLDLRIEAGEVLGYLGPNGAGKSTTIGLLLGLIRPTSGSAEILGLDVRRDLVALHRRIAYVPSQADLWLGLTGAETIELLGNLHGSVDVRYRAELVERFRLAPNRKVRTLSHGNRQKLLLVAALASRAEVLLLDEPTTGLDPLMQQVFRDCLREARDRGQSVLLSSHELSEVEAVCDRVAMLRDGRLIESGRLDRLRRVVARRVRCRFPDHVPDLSGVAGVGHTRADGRWLECDVSGSMAPLLSALVATGAVELATREPTLEELFVAAYGVGTPAGRSWPRAPSRA